MHTYRLFVCVCILYSVDLVKYENCRQSDRPFFLKKKLCIIGFQKKISLTIK